MQQQSKRGAVGVDVVDALLVGSHGASLCKLGESFGERDFRDQKGLGYVIRIGLSIGLSDCFYGPCSTCSGKVLHERNLVVECFRRIFRPGVSLIMRWWDALF